MLGNVELGTLVWYASVGYACAGDIGLNIAQREVNVCKNIWGNDINTVWPSLEFLGS